MKKLYSFLFFILLLLKPVVGFCYNWLHDWNRLIMRCTVADGFSPLLTSRAYVYPNIGAYVVLTMMRDDLPQLYNRLNDFPPLPEKAPANYDFDIIALATFYTVAKKMVYRDDWCDSLYLQQLERLKPKNLNQAEMDENIQFGVQFGQIINQWADKDGYLQTKAKSNYIFVKSDSTWKPTPPEFRNATEPYWGMLRPLLITHIDSFILPPPQHFSTDTASMFFKENQSLYELSKSLTTEQKLIADFWDDNPDMNTFTGHIPNPRRHISPVSHWMNIVTQVCENKNADVQGAAYAYTMTAIALFESKICVWKNKYKYNFIRPVTYIRQYIDPQWMPQLVTPPFPEYPSGHSACSMAAALVLQEIFPAETSFADRTLLKFGLPERQFGSFVEAAKEVSESRVYGGIHYKFGVEQGMKLGERIAKEIINAME